MFILLFLFVTSFLPAAQFTVSSYNCGGLSEHYDYIREVAMQKLMQERYRCEPELLSQVEKAEQLALKILFAPEEVALREWENRGYSQLINDMAHSDGND